MSIGKVTHITAESDTSFEAAIQEGVARASETVRNMKSAWVKDYQVRIDNGRVAGWRVHLEITFLIDD